MANDPQKAGETGTSSSQARPEALQSSRSAVDYDTSKALPLYSNCFQATGTPEEVVLDFGLNPLSPSDQSVRVRQRVILNFFTAKRLNEVLHALIQNHEAAYGVLETDVGKRGRAGARMEDRR